MNNSRQSWRAKIQAYIVERRDEANNEFDEFCARWRIRPPKRVQEQQRRTACRRVKADEDLVGIDAENQTNEQFVERGEETYSRPMNSNITRDQASGSKQHADNSQYRNRDCLNQPDEIDMFFSDTQSNENMPQSLVFYNNPSITSNQRFAKRVSFSKNKLDGRSTIPKQTPSPIRKPVFKRNPIKAQTPLSLPAQNMDCMDSYDIDRRLAKLEVEVPIVQNRVHQLLNDHMIESDAYPVAGTLQRISSTGSIVASSSDTNSPPRTPCHQTTHIDMMSPGHYFTPKTPGSVMTSNYTTHPIYHYNNHSTNTPTSYKNTFSPNTNHSEYHVGSLRKILKPTRLHKSYMRKVLYQMAFKELRRTDMILNAHDELVPNPYWEEIYGEKHNRF